MKFNIYIVSSILTVSLLFSGCSIQKNNDALSVVTTITPLYSLTKNITEGSQIEVNNIVPPGSSIHTFQMTPSTAINIENADLIIMNGVSLEVFINDIINENPNKIVDTSQSIELINNDGEYDPHIWVSPRNAIVQAKNIKEAIIKLDPENKQLYESNFLTLKNQLEIIDSEIESTISTLNLSKYIVFHDAYGYFDKDYGLKPSAYIKESVNKESSPEELKNIIDLIQKEKVDIIFSEPQFSPKLLETLKEDYNIRVYTLDPLGQELSKDSYFKMIRSNISNFQNAFKQKL